MLNQLEQAQERWGGSNQVIDTWLKERQDVLVSYCELAGLPPFDKKDSALPSLVDVKRFCQVLVDYISTGHFEVFDKIVAQCSQNGPASTELANKLYPQINTSTDVVLEFNDKFAEQDDQKGFHGFDQGLAKLGQALEQRFELEDKLIAELFHKHS